jgi:pimeloyl-ACP methyl ester carboxylesterase
MNPVQVEIPVGWGKISVQIFGDAEQVDAKPIIALHGYLDNSNSFKPLAPFLTKDQPYYVIAVDLPGMGFSSKIPDGIPYTLKFYLMAIRRVILHLKIGKFFFAAHSFGGIVAMTVMTTK